VVDDEVATLGPSASPGSLGESTLPGGRDAASAPSEDDRIPSAGESIGNFVVQGQLGAGAAGVVLLALDPELDRQVAIKLLSAGGKGPVARARLVREARSAASLQHPNVVAVFQVGTHDDQVYVVMEYVDGGTLREWAAASERDWASTLEVYRQAGLGLAAAHAARLVHRDFKPDNVLIDSAGRVRVSDFGLVGHTGEQARGIADLSTSALGATDEDALGHDSLTRTGAVMGTPAYMSPEQMAGDEIDATADQFAFCVALYEALWGRRPFRGASLPNLVAAVHRGPDAPPRSTVPSEIQAAVMRGLSLSPRDRHSSMSALLRALGPAKKRRRTGWVVGGAGLLAAGGGAAYVLSGTPTTAEAGADAAAVAAGPQCDHGAADWGTVWDPAARSALRAAFFASSHPGADGAFERVAAVLDARRAEWIAAADDLCAAGDEPSIPGAPAAACLALVRTDLAGFVDALSDVDPGLVDGAMLRAPTLPRAAACVDPSKPQWVDPTAAPTGGLARTVRRLELTLAGQRSAAAYQGAGAVLPALREAGEAGLLARTLLVRGTAGMRIGAPPTLAGELREAMVVAAGESAHGIEAEATATLMGVLMVDPAGLASAAAVLPGAEAAARRSGDLHSEAVVGLAASMLIGKQGDAAGALARVDTLIGRIEQAAGPSEALALALAHRAGQRIAAGGDADGGADLDRALALVTETVGEGHPQYAVTLYHAASVHLARGNYAAAVQGFGRAAASFEASLGAHARMTVSAGLQRGRATLHGGDPVAARPIYQEALERCEQSVACDGRLRGVVLENLAWADLVGRHYEDAASHYDSAMAALLDAPGDHAAVRSRLQRFLGYTADAAGDHAAAQGHFEAMRAAQVEAHGPKHEYVIWATNLAANSARYRGDCDKARAGYRRSLGLREDLAMTPGPYLAEIMLGLGECEWAEGKIKAARESLTTAYGLRESNLEPDIAAGIRFAYARLQWADGDKTDAIALATAARQQVAHAGVPRDAAVARVDAWLAEHASSE